MVRGDKDTAQLHRAWLRALPDITGLSLSKIADRARIARTTLTDPLAASDDGTSTLSAKTIQKVVQTFNVEPPSYTPSGAALRAVRGLADEAMPYEWKGGDPNADTLKAMMAGRRAADAWVIRSRALDVMGYMPGDIVIVEIGRPPQIGDIVCAQVNIDTKRGTAETVMRIFQRAGASLMLMAASNDPLLQQPIAVDDRVEIRGVVIGLLRPIAANRAA